MVLHERRSDDHYVLVCEIKRSTDARPRNVDHDTLVKLTRDGGEYEYDLGAFVEIIQAENRIALNYYKNGAPASPL